MKSAIKLPVRYATSGGSCLIFDADINTVAKIDGRLDESVDPAQFVYPGPIAQQIAQALNDAPQLRKKLERVERGLREWKRAGVECDADDIIDWLLDREFGGK